MGYLVGGRIVSEAFLKSIWRANVLFSVEHTQDKNAGKDCGAPSFEAVTIFI
jgi:hypothetical protein